MAAGPSLQVRMLDGFSVELADGGKPCRFERPSARRLLQALLLRPGRRAGREELAEILFPQLSPKRAANAVSKALTLARAALEPARETILAADRSTIWIRDDAQVSVDLDAHVAALKAALTEQDPARRTELLEAALAVRGRLLDDELYADWAIAARDELERLRAQACLALARARTARQGGANLASLIEAWAQVAVHDPASDEACIELVRAYAQAGQRDLVVRAYHRYRAAAGELGLEPAEAVEAAYSEALPTATTAPRPIAPTPAPAPLVFGRGQELDRLVRGLRRHGALLVSGPAGIGKTHLLRAAAYRLERAGWRTLRGTAVPDDRRAPFASLRTALAPLLGDFTDDDSPLARLAGSGRAESHVHRGLEPEAEDERARLAGQLVELLDAASAATPILLVLDDVQWADDELRSLLARLLAQERPRRWAAALGARSDEPDAPMPGLSSIVERLELGPLGERDIRALARAAVGGRLRRARLAEIVERSAGNPFFAVELARQYEGADSALSTPAHVPAAISALLLDRIGRCSAAARRMVPVVALTGAEASYELLLSVGSDRALAGSPERAVEALDELVDAHLLVETEGGVRPAHPLLRDAALARVNALRRSALHARVAEALEELKGDAEAVARHWLAAFEVGRLRQHAVRAARAGFVAGRRARDMLAYEAAIELLRGGLAAFEAAAAEERGALRGGAVLALLDIGDVLCRREEESEGKTAYESALALAVTDEELARVWRSMGEIPYRRGDMEGAMEELRQGLGSLSGESPLPRAMLSCDLGWALHRLGRYEEALETLSEAYLMLEREGEPADAGYCADLVAITLSALGRREEALSVSEEAFRLAELAGSRRLRAMQHVHRAQILRGLGRPEEAMDHAREAGTAFDVPRDRYKRSVVHWIVAEIRDDLGDLEGALGERDAEAALLIEIGNQLNLSRAEAHRAQLLERLDRKPEAKQAAETARAAAARVDDPDWTTRVEAWLSGGKISGRVAP